MSNASDVERGNFIEHNGELLQVVRKEVISVGTHSHSKLKFYVVGLEGKGEKSIVLAHNDKVEILDIIRKTAIVLSKSPQKIQIMDTVSYETLDAECEPSIMQEINEGDEVIYISYNGIVKVLHKKK
jgi:translation elongation factor P/translation initiation factor 5A